MAAGIRKYCMNPDAFAGKRMELAEGSDGMCESGGVVPENGSELAKLPRTPTTLARWFAFLLEWGPKPCLSRSEVELRVTDNALDPHTNCISFEDLGVRRMGKVERRLFLTAWSRRGRERLYDMEMEYSRRLMMETQL